MRLADVWMVPVDQDYAFPGQLLLQLGIRLGCLTMISRVPCTGFVCCVARQEGGDSFIVDPFKIFSLLLDESGVSAEQWSSS